MISTNLQQRDNLLPSERAFAYRMQLETMKRQGTRTDLTSPQVAAKFRSDDEIAKADGTSGDTVRRYIRLTYLIPSLLNLVDNRQLNLTSGEILSYLNSKNQQIVENFFFCQRHLGIDHRTAEKLRELAEAGELTDQQLQQTFFSSPVKPLKKIRVDYKSIRRYFNENTTEKEIKDTIQKALELYFTREKKESNINDRGRGIEKQISDDHGAV